MWFRKILGFITGFFVFILVILIAGKYIFIHESGADNPLLRIIVMSVGFIAASTTYYWIKGEEPPETEEKPKALTNEEISQKLKEKRNS